MAQKSLLRPQKATQTVFVARLKIAVTVEPKNKEPLYHEESLLDSREHNEDWILAKVV